MVEFDFQIRFAQFSNNYSDSRREAAKHNSPAQRKIGSLIFRRAGFAL
jgi:hypothetical protein